MNKYGLYLLPGVIIYNLIDYIYIYIYVDIAVHLYFCFYTLLSARLLKVLLEDRNVAFFNKIVGIKVSRAYFSTIYIYMRLHKRRQPAKTMIHRFFYDVNLLSLLIYYY